MVNVLMIEDDTEFAAALSEYLEKYNIKITNYEDPYLGISAGIIGVFMYLYQFLYIYRKTKITASVNIIAEISAPFVCTFVLVSIISLTTVGNPFIYFAAFLMGMGLNSIDWY